MVLLPALDLAWHDVSDAHWAAQAPWCSSLIGYFVVCVEIEFGRKSLPLEALPRS